MVSDNNVKKIAVFCAWHDGKNPRFKKEAEILGKAIADAGYTLVYGSSLDGLMGVLAQSVLAGGSKVIAHNAKIFNYCIQPKHNNFKYYEHDTLEERQRALIDEADAYVVFAGGFGTLFEYFHAINLMQIGIISKKPVVIVNIDGMYDNLLMQMSLMKEEDLASLYPFQTVVSSSLEVIDAINKGFEKCRSCLK